MTLIATQVKRRRGTTAENDAFTGAEGEITVDTTTHELRVHDGSTVGGYTIPKKDYGYSKAEADDLLSNKANIALNNITNAGKEVCANMSMPSNRFANLTLGASDSTYTMPADGYLTFGKNATAVSQYLLLVNDSSGLEVVNKSSSNSGYVQSYIVVKKGDSIRVNYTLAGATHLFRFIYANGAQ